MIKEELESMDKNKLIGIIEAQRFEIQDLTNRCIKVKEYLVQIHTELQHGIISSDYLIWENINRLCDGKDILEKGE